MQNFMLCIGIIISVIGVKFIYDARPIAQKYFSSNDKSIATKILKAIGFILLIVGVFLLIKFL